MKVKVLSIKEPFASLIVDGIKDVENRTRQTNYRGVILIHASKLSTTEKRQCKTADLLTPDQIEAIINSGLSNYYFGQMWQSGAIIGICTLKDCTMFEKSIWADPQCYQLVMENPEWFDNPITGCKGQLGLWEIDTDKVPDKNVRDQIINYIKAYEEKEKA